MYSLPHLLPGLELGLTMRTQNPCQEVKALPYFCKLFHLTVVVCVCVCFCVCVCVCVNERLGRDVFACGAWKDFCVQVFVFTNTHACTSVIGHSPYQEARDVCIMTPTAPATSGISVCHLMPHSYFLSPLFFCLVLLLFQPSPVTLSGPVTLSV